MMLRSQSESRRTRSLPFALRLALALMVWLVPGAVGCGAGDAVRFTVENVADGVRLFRPADGGPNTMVVERGDGLLLVDAQPDVARARALLTAIRAETAAPVRYVVISHPHREAMGGLPAFEGALVIAAASASRPLADPEFDYEAELADAGDDTSASADRPPVTLLVGGEIELADPRLSVRIQPGTSGHSPGELIVSVHDGSLIHLGGMGFADGNPFGGTANVTRWIGTLNRIARESPTTIVGTRGPALDIRALRKRRNALAWVRAEVLEAVMRGTSWELVAAEVTASPKAAEYFDTNASPSFLHGVVERAVEELRAQRRKRGVE